MEEGGGGGERRGEEEEEVEERRGEGRGGDEVWIISWISFCLLCCWLTHMKFICHENENVFLKLFDNDVQ